MGVKTVTSAVAGLVVALLPGPAGADDGAADFSLDRSTAATATSTRAAGPADQLVSAAATFDTRATGMPAAGSQPHQQFVPGASVVVDYAYDSETGVVNYNYSLSPSVAAVQPSDETNTLAGFGLGVFSGTTCNVDTDGFDAVSEFNTDLFIYGSGDATASPNAGLWDCAVIFTTGLDANSPPYDAFVSPLAITTAAPQVTMSAPRKDRLVPKVWTEVLVKVANAEGAQVNARDLRVVGSGKGVKVKGGEVGGLVAGEDAEAQLWVKLTKPKATVRFTATELGQQVATASTKVVQRKAPAPPKAGRWSGDGASFTVSGGKVKGFRITARTTCGGYPDLPTMTTNTYDFPTVAIPRNNEVIEADQGNVGSDAEYGVQLRVEFVSPTKAKGTFSYAGPARCRAIEALTVKRR